VYVQLNRSLAIDPVLGNPRRLLKGGGCAEGVDVLEYFSRLESEAAYGRTGCLSSVGTYGLQAGEDIKIRFPAIIV